MGLAALTLGGWGILSVLLPERYRGGGAVLAPVAGLALLIVLGNIGISFGLGMKILVWIFLALGISLIFLAKRQNLLLTFDWKEHLAPLAAFFVTYIFCVFPLFRLGESFPITINIDSIYYSEISRWIWSHGLPANDPRMYSPGEILTAPINHGTWIGFNFLHSSLSGLTSIPPYKSFALTIGFTLSLIHFSLYFFLRNALELRRSVCVVLIFIFAFHAGMIWVAYDGFAAQATGLVLMTAAVSLSFAALELASLPLALLSGIFLSAIFSSYTIVMPHVVLILLCYILYLMIGKKIKPLSALGWMALLGLISLALCGPRLWAQIGNLCGISLIASAQIGGNVNDFIPLSELFSLSHHRAQETIAAESQGLTIAAWTLFCVALWQMMDTSRHRREKIISAIFPLIIGLIFLRMFKNYPYGYFKQMVLFAPFMWGVLGVSADLFLEESFRRGRLRRLTALFLSGIAGWLLFSGAQTSTTLAKTYYRQTKDLRPIISFSEKIRTQIKPDPARPLHLRDTQYNLLWFSYFLPEYPLNFQTTEVQQFLFGAADIYRDYIGAGRVVVSQSDTSPKPWRKTKPLLSDAHYAMYNVPENLVAHIPLDSPVIILPRQWMEIRYADNNLTLSAGKWTREGSDVTFPNPSRPSGELNEPQTLRKWNFPLVSYYFKKDAATRLIDKADFLRYFFRAGSFQPRKPFAENAPARIFSFEHARARLLVYASRGPALRVGEDVLPQRKVVCENIFYSLDDENGMFITNLGSEPLVLLPWIDLINGEEKGAVLGAGDPVLPFSNVQCLSGWYPEELDATAGRRYRWGKSETWAVIPVLPGKEHVLELAGNLAGSGTIELNVDGYRESFAGDPNFQRTIQLNDVREGQRFHLLRLKSSNTLFNGRELGLCVTKLQARGAEEIFNLSGGRIDFGTPEARPMLSHGWTAFDEVWKDSKTGKNNTYVWGLYPGSQVKFYLDEKARMKLIIHATALESTSQQKVTVNLNAEVLGEFTPTPNVWQDYEFEIPESAARAGMNVMLLMYSGYYCPQEADPSNKDPRRLSLAVDSIQFLPHKTEQDRLLAPENKPQPEGK